MQEVAKTMIIVGIIIIAAGVILLFLGKFGFIGKLPGDILVQKKNFTFYFPLTTSLLVSLLISFSLWLWSRR